MKRIKSSAMRRKSPNTTRTGNEVSEDFEVELILEGLEAKADSEVSEGLIFEILTSATLWAGFLAEDSADDLGEKAPRAEKTSKLP